MTLAAGSMVPWWVVVPAAGLTMAVVLWHLRGQWRSEVPASRRRIRTANAVFMLVFAPLLAYAVGVVTPDQTRAFALAWVGVIALLVVIMMLAGLDIVNNLRLFRASRAALMHEARRATPAARGPGAAEDAA